MRRQTDAGPGLGVDRNQDERLHQELNPPPPASHTASCSQIGKANSSRRAIDIREHLEEKAFATGGP
ncbi:GD11026 [Drosophila simulans]|uniref:GD11026 n=1 Tax=Drosophila simulans TaxID=7240 RepID=B4NVW2_DROSI|nr:GD11026 [Drosophila simulans]